MPGYVISTRMSDDLVGLKIIIVIIEEGFNRTEEDIGIPMEPVMDFNLYGNAYCRDILVLDIK